MVMRRHSAACRGAFTLSKSRQCVSRHPEDRPLVEWPRAQAFVELDRGRIPVEHRPFEAPAAALHRNPRELSKQLAADAQPPELGLDEEIFQVESTAPEERREVVEEQDEAGGP